MVKREWYNKRNNESYLINKSEIESRDLMHLGAEPFVEKKGDIRPIAFDLESILFTLNILGKDKCEYDIDGIRIASLNWNPFVFSRNSKQFYQRGFVWGQYDNQLLIESIYQGIDCGKILVRKRSFDELRALKKAGEICLAFYDLVDGKQRLNAIRGFLLGEYPDLHGNYYADLSNMAQHQLVNNQLFSYAEMPEKTKDADVISQFLKLNFTGIPQSKEHIDYVRSIQSIIE